MRLKQNPINLNIFAKMLHQTMKWFTKYKISENYTSFCIMWRAMNSSEYWWKFHSHWWKFSPRCRNFLCQKDYWWHIAMLKKCTFFLFQFLDRFDLFFFTFIQMLILSYYNEAQHFIFHIMFEIGYGHVQPSAGAGVQ